jgi:hypothetical protein
MKALYFHIITFIFLFCPDRLCPQGVKLSDSLAYLNNYSRLNHSFVEIGMFNDYNPIFNIHCNDDGYTLGLYIDARIKKGKTGNFFDMGYKSDLYTKYLKDRAKNYGNRKIIPQYFTEVSYAFFDYHIRSEKYKCFFSLGAGLGINNRQKALWGLSLYVQGGKDGKGGYHSILNNNPGTENIPTGSIKPVFFIYPSVSKAFTVATLNSNKHLSFVELELGARIGTRYIGSEIFFKSHVEIPVTEIHYKQYTLFSWSVVARNELSCGNNGLLNMPEFGTEVRLGFLTVGFTTIYNFGYQSASIISWTDNDPLMRGYIAFNF